MSSEALVLASDSLSTRLGIEKRHMLDTIKAQCFKGVPPDRVSDTQLAAYVQVAQALNVNPLLPGMLYAYPERNGGITPIIGPDGIFSMLASHPNVRGWEVRHETIDGEPAATATIRHEKLGEMKKTVFLREWIVGNNPNWQTRPRHMLEIRALKQCARQCIHGIPFDAEEYKMAEQNRGFEHALAVGAAGEEQAANHANGAENPAPAERPKAPARRGSAAAAKAAQADTAVDVHAAPATNGNTSDASAPASAQTSSAPASDTQPAARIQQQAEAPTSEKSSAATNGNAKTETTTADKPAAKAPPPTPPDIAPGVSFAGFHGKAWPQLLRMELTSVEPAQTPAGKPLIKLGVKHEGYTGDALTFEGVEIREEGDKKLPVITKPFLKVGQVIEANFRAKLRPSKVKDAAGVAEPDYTKPPALFAENISAATGGAFEDV